MHVPVSFKGRSHTLRPFLIAESFYLMTCDHVDASFCVHSEVAEL